MLRLKNINIDKNPELIQPPQVVDNIVVLELIPDTQELIQANILDVALSYAIAGIGVILEMEFNNRHKFNNKHLVSLICNGNWSLSLLAPKLLSKDNKKHNNKSNTQLGLKYTQEYVQHIITWYQLWRSQTMINFAKAIYPITPYLEYLTTNYLITKNQQQLSPQDIQELITLSQNPSHAYMLDLIKHMPIDVTYEFKQQLKDFIQTHDLDFYVDVDGLIAQC